MTREEIFRDIEGTLGVVPTMFKAVPSDTLELEWNLFKRVQLNEETLPAKYRELVGLAAGAALGDPYCVLAHRELAKVCGATEEEIECAIRLAKGVAGWGTYMRGLDLSIEDFRGEIGQVCNFVRTTQVGGVGLEAPAAGVAKH